MKKNLRKTNKKEFRIEKVFKRKDDKLYFKWKELVTHLIVGLIKKDLV